jgi:hypothetical protein
MLFTPQSLNRIHQRSFDTLKADRDQCNPSRQCSRQGYDSPFECGLVGEPL